MSVHLRCDWVHQLHQFKGTTSTEFKTCCSFSNELWPQQHYMMCLARTINTHVIKMNLKGQVVTLSKWFVHKVDILLISVFWTLLTGKCSWLVLDILYYLISGLSYHSTNFLTRIRTMCNFATCQFHTLVVSLVHTGGPATSAIAQEPQVSHYKASSIHLHRDISTHHGIHPMGRPFVFVATLCDCTLPSWLK